MFQSFVTKLKALWAKITSFFGAKEQKVKDLDTAVAAKVADIKSAVTGPLPAPVVVTVAPVAPTSTVA